jgi:predicted short-subunit dehydrogenase-like oxidoreductase (DUF2520 family)
MYPVQTFTKDRQIDFKHIPFCIEGSDAATAKKILTLAKSVSQNVVKLNSHQRLKVHLAAVFANNFTNHLFTISEKILRKEKIPFDILHELIATTAVNVWNDSPSKAQTGPAMRGDKKIIEEHLKMLSGEKEIQELYKLITKSIERG